MNSYWIVLLVIVGTALLCTLWIFLLAYIGMRSVCFFKGRTREKCIAYDTTHGLYTKEEYEELSRTGEHFTVKSPYGYDIKALRLLCGNVPADRVVIIVHGFGCHMYTSVKYVRVFRELGYDCIIYDHRYHGESGGDFCTLSGLETDDLMAVVEAVGKMYPDGTNIGLHGESMGAATVMNVLARDFPFAFCVADCGYASAAEELRYLTRRYTFLFRKPVYRLMLGLIQKKTGVDFEGVAPIQAVSSEQAAQIPVLFIHGEADRFVPFDNVQRLYEAKKGVKALYTVSGARHAESLKRNPEEYKERVRAFCSVNQ